jgi:TPP-dependent pyruvate/acetoin dehydrogenase alpha subunit
VRFRKFLEAKGCWDGAKQEKLEAEVRAEIDAAVATFEKPVERKLDAPFDHVLGGSNGWLETQRGQFKSRHGLAR